MHNDCTFIGRLGKDPDVRTLETGRTVTQFSIACDEPGYTTKDGKEVPKKTEWIPIVVWDKAAENAGKYLHKGSLVMVKGKFRTRSYEKERSKDLPHRYLCRQRDVSRTQKRRCTRATRTGRCRRCATGC